MKSKQKTYFDKGMTNILVLLCCVYAFVVCYCCYIVLNEHTDFGVESIAQSEQVWRVSE